MMEPLSLFSGIVGFFSKAPKWVYAVIGILGAVLFLLWLHGHWVKQHDKQLTDEIYAKVQKSADELKAKADRLAQSASRVAKEKNDEAHGRIDARGDALLLRGPGRAACASVAGPSAPADKRPVGPDETDASVAGVYNQQWEPLVGLPYADTIAFAKQHDKCLADLRSYEQRDALIAASRTGSSSQ